MKDRASGNEAAGRRALILSGSILPGSVLHEVSLVRFENVGLRYGMGAEILKDISFAIGPQSFQFLTGPSGAGKTTLLRLILLSLRPTRGAIAIGRAHV